MSASSSEVEVQSQLLKKENENYDKNFSLLEQFHIIKSNYDNKMANLNIIEQTIAKMKEEIASISQRNIEKQMKINKYNEELKEMGNIYDCASVKGYDVAPIGNGLRGN